MKIKKRCVLYNGMMLLTSIGSIGVISILFLILFIVNCPIEEMNLTRTALINPAVLAEAIGVFFKNHPDAFLYVFLWAGLCISITVLANAIATHFLSRGIENSVADLQKAARKVADGELEFEVLGSDCDEINDLCDEFDHMRRQLKYAKTQEQIMQNERSMLLANLSHDLKTPITSIRGYVEGLKDGIANTDEKREKYLNTIYQKAGLIDELVRNISEFSRLEMGKIEFSFQKLEMNQFILQIFQTKELDMELEHMTYTVKPYPDNVYFYGDEIRIRRVFVNIIENAMKYKKGNSGHIEANIISKNQSVFVSVSDTGMGIPNQELGKVFDRFYRIDPSRTPHIKGSGLGLGIAKQIIEGHNGSIWIRSEGEDKGTTVTVRLPLYQEQNQ